MGPDTSLTVLHFGFQRLAGECEVTEGQGLLLVPVSQP